MSVFESQRDFVYQPSVWDVGATLGKLAAESSTLKELHPFPAGPHPARGASTLSGSRRFRMRGPG